MTNTPKSIETRYAGHRFRSRLEARWAVALDHLGVKWRYESEGYELGDLLGCYLPDFWLPDLNTFLEIKPGKPSDRELQKLLELIAQKQSFGAFGFNLGDTPVAWHSPPTSAEDDRYSWHTTYPWPKELPRPEGQVVLWDIPRDQDCDLVCPVCGENYVHLDDPVNLGDFYPHREFGQRGPVHAFSAMSEGCWHSWQLLVGFHKGNTQIAVAYDEDGNRTPLELLLASPRGLEAIDKGRGARFEHGEKG